MKYPVTNNSITTFKGQINVLLDMISKKSIDREYILAMKEDYLRKLRFCIRREMRHYEINSTKFKQKEFHSAATKVAKKQYDYWWDDPNEPVEKIGYIVFGALEWKNLYGGKAWFNICELTQNLAKHDSTNEIVKDILSIILAKHNTGHVLSKIGYEEYWLSAMTPLITLSSLTVLPE